MSWGNVWFQAGQGFSEFGCNLLHNLHIRRRVLPDASIRLDGQTIIVTGANRSIGKAITEELAIRGGRVIMACRDLTLADAAAADIRSRHPRADLSCSLLDLSSFKSIRSFADDVKRREITD